MTIELIVFIASILFGILLYWRESNGNGLYRMLDKVVNAKELQMKPNDKTGFVYKQKFLLRVVYISILFIVIMLLLKFLIPINYATVSVFASSIVGTVLGTYIANFVFKSGKVIDEKGDSLSNLVSDTIEKGKEIIEDMKSKSEEIEDEVIEEVEAPEDKSEEPQEEKKSARERLKDKGFLK